MAGTEILVTGGCGRIGKRLVKRLVSAGISVTVLDTKHGDIDGVKYITAPIMEVADLSNIDIVYHLAATIDYKSSKEELTKLNVMPTAQLLTMCTNCRQFIFMSSTSVYGESKEPITEETGPNPYTNYGWSKLESEKIIIKSKKPYTILRSSQVFGPEFEEGYATILKALEKGKMRIFGEGKNYVPLVHINDLIDALVLVMDNKLALNQVFNVDGNYGKTQEEFLQLAAKVLDVDPPGSRMRPAMARLAGVFTRKGAKVGEYIEKLTKNRRIAIDKIRGLGFDPKVSLEKGIREVVEDFRERGLLNGV
jgi:UDP-glucose 4-epimerase